MAHHGWQRLIMHDLKIDQPRAVARWGVNEVVQMGISVRPPIIKLGTPQLVRPAELSAGGFKRTRRERAALPVLAEMHPGNRIHANRSRTFTGHTKTGFLEQTKAIYLPALPFPGIDPNVNAALS